VISAHIHRSSPYSSGYLSRRWDLWCDGICFSAFGLEKIFIVANTRVDQNEFPKILDAALNRKLVIAAKPQIQVLEITSDSKMVHGTSQFTVLFLVVSCWWGLIRLTQIRSLSNSVHGPGYFMEPSFTFKEGRSYYRAFKRLRTSWVNTNISTGMKKYGRKWHSRVENIDPERTKTIGHGRKSGLQSCCDRLNRMDSTMNWCYWTQRC